MAHFCVHIAHSVLRFVAIEPNGEAVCQKAIANTPGAAYTLLPGPLPKDVEAAAKEFRDTYLSGLADKFLDSHGYTDSGVFPKLRAV